MKRYLKSFYLFITIVGIIAITPGLSQPLKFTLEKLNMRSLEWSTTMVVYSGDVIRMTCTAVAATSSLLLIRRENDSLPLTQSNGTTVTHNFSKILCQDMDSYICEHKQGQKLEKKTIELGIYGCPPRPCDGDTTQHIIYYVEVGETKNLSLCVIVYPDISKYAYFNNTQVLGNTLLSEDSWTWFFEGKGFNKFIINVTARDITTYSETTFQISNLFHDKLSLKYTLVLRKSVKMKPLKFTLKKRRVYSRKWNTITQVYSGDVIRITCTAGAADTSLLLIRRENDSWPSVASNDTTVSLKFGTIQCWDMDSYICEHKQGQNVEKATRDLGIHGCPPRPCDGDTTYHIIYAEVGETKNLSLCVTVYPDISKVANFNDTQVLGNTPLSDDSWTWFFERKGFNKFMINVTARNITTYSETTFRISTLSSDKLSLNYTLVLRKPQKPRKPDTTLDDKVECSNITYAVLGPVLGVTGFVISVGAVILIIRRNLKRITKTDKRPHAVPREEEEPHYEVILEDDLHAETSFMNIGRVSAEDGNHRPTEDNGYLTPLDTDPYSQ